MKNTIIILSVALATLSACNKAQVADKELTPAISPVKSIIVTSGGKTVETYSFSYDEKGRVSSLLRRSEIESKDLLNLSYKYDGKSGFTVCGKMEGKLQDRIVDVKYRKDGVVYSCGDWNGWEYYTSSSEGSVSSSFEANSGIYSSSMNYGEVYTYNGNDIAIVEQGTRIESKVTKGLFQKTEAFKPVTLNSESSLKTSYSYCEKFDRQNFCAFVFNGNFPIWYATGLPGCQHLVSDMNFYIGESASDHSQHFDYILNDNGDISKVTRIWSKDGKPYLTFEYEFKYE